MGVTTSRVVKVIKNELAQQAISQRQGLKNPFVDLVGNIARPSYFEVPSLATAKKNVRFALISLPELPLRDPTKVKIKSHWIVRSERRADLDEAACERRLVEFSANFAREHERWYSEALMHSLETVDADVVCVNELGIPSYRQRPYKKALELTRSLAEEHQAFVVAGSSHDSRTFYNSGHVFFPGCPPQGQIFHKQVSALAVEERISLPPERKARCARVFGLRIAMLICLDVADFASVAAVVKASDQIDVLLVPCYSEWMDPLERIARHASKAMAGLVALVNYRRVGQPGYVISKFGRPIEVDKSDELQSGARVHSFLVDVEEFRSQKDQLQSSMSPDDRLEWLFGPQNQPIRAR